MKSLRLLALALLACCSVTSAALACDAPKSAASGTSATTASATPTVPADGGCSATALTANGAHSCSGAKGAMVRGAGFDHCSGARGTAVTAATLAGMVCAEHMNGVAHDCSACEDWASCEQAMRALGARTQVVALKNGAMIVYTADSKSDIKALQALVAKRNDRLVTALSAGNDKKLCDDCKQMRGAMASGKLNREVVNVERGCLTLITSNDRGVVQKIRNMTGQPLAMR